MPLKLESGGKATEGLYGMRFDITSEMYLHVDMPSSTARAKLFRHGGSQAARLPREFRLPGREAAISRTSSGGVLLEPLDADFEARRRRFFALAGSCPGLPDVPPHSTSDIPRDE
jgi:antitoxin VapB